MEFEVVNIKNAPPVAHRGREDRSKFIAALKAMGDGECLVAPVPADMETKKYRERLRSSVVNNLRNPEERGRYKFCMSRDKKSIVVMRR